MKRVLIAEDRAGSRELIRTVLEDHGCEVIEAADGGEAVAQAERYVPDLVVLDLGMPVLDGYGVLAHLRRDARFLAVPFVALTANAMKGECERALAAGFSVYIAKPVDITVLRNQLTKLLASKP